MFKYVSIGFFLVCFNLVGQELKPGLSKPAITGYPVQNKRLFTPQELGKPVTAVVARSEEPGNFWVVVKDDTLHIPPDPHADPFTYFISLPNPSPDLTVLSDGTPFESFFIHSGRSPKGFSPARIEIPDQCGDPLPFIPQSEWRSGLDPPDYSRSFHTVNHTIVHHSAGSNGNENYTQVVRDIYILHTEVNGWSDIGYNYLIAQDGSLYAGRDPGTGDQDLVRGAHFCGKNTGTLGICLLGNFETAVPTDTAWQVLESFLTYAMINLSLDPLEEKQHSTGILTTISGHRDGCATLCPGENVYHRMGELRSTVADRLVACIGQPQLALEFDSLTGVGEPIVFMNESSGYNTYSWIFPGGIPDINGNELSVSVTYLNPGIYDVILIGHTQNDQDTLLLPGAVKATYFPETPLLYPNPISASQTLKIDFEHTIDAVTLYDIQGDRIEIEYPVIDRNTVEPGLYFLRVHSGEQVYMKKLLVR